MIQQARRRNVASFAMAVSMVVPSVLGNAAWAWEQDVHYGLTKWLAIKIGYTDQQAEWIAGGAQEVDDSWKTGPIWHTSLACTFGNRDSSLTVHDNHFPSRYNPPLEPAKRVVVARKIWKKEKQRTRPTLNDGERSFNALGGYLHAFQDSWSHAGEPDMPTTCLLPNFAWGHPVTRGGWACNYADQTNWWKDEDVPEMAHATYKELVAARGLKPSEEWEGLRAKIDEFAKAKTKWQKDKWFARENFSNRHFLEEISLPTCETDRPCQYGHSLVMTRWNKAVADHKYDNEGVPDDIVTLFVSFFTALTQKDKNLKELSNLIEKASAQDALARALHVQPPCAGLYDTLFDFYLGRGFDDNSGAHQPSAVCKLAINLGKSQGIAMLQRNQGNTISCTDAKAAANEAINSVLSRGPKFADVRKETPTPVIYSLFASPDKEKFMAVARFVHLPRDVLLVEAKKMAGGPKVTSFIWAPNE